MEPLIYLTGVVALGLGAQWLAWRLRLPAILLLLAFGFLFGLIGGADTDPESMIGSRWAWIESQLELNLTATTSED